MSSYDENTHINIKIILKIESFVLFINVDHILVCILIKLRCSLIVFFATGIIGIGVQGFGFLKFGHIFANRFIGIIVIRTVDDGFHELVVVVVVMSFVFRIVVVLFSTVTIDFLFVFFVFFDGGFSNVIFSTIPFPLVFRDFFLAIIDEGFLIVFFLILTIPMVHFLSHFKRKKLIQHLQDSNSRLNLRRIH